MRGRALRKFSFPEPPRDDQPGEWFYADRHRNSRSFHQIHLIHLKQNILFSDRKTRKMFQLEKGQTFKKNI